jgi:hypothetical protein
MRTTRTILGSLCDGIRVGLATRLSGDQAPDPESENAEITAEDVFNILTRAKMRQAEGLPASVE